MITVQHDLKLVSLLDFIDRRLYAYRARADGGYGHLQRLGGAHRPRCILPAAKWSEPFFVQARPTSAADVVKAWKLNDKREKVKVDGAIGTKQIFVED